MARRTAAPSSCPPTGRGGLPARRSLLTSGRCGALSRTTRTLLGASMWWTARTPPTRCRCSYPRAGLARSVRVRCTRLLRIPTGCANTTSTTSTPSTRVRRPKRCGSTTTSSRPTASTLGPMAPPRTATAATMANRKVQKTRCQRRARPTTPPSRWACAGQARARRAHAARA